MAENQSSFMFKILVVGCGGVGKTCAIKKLVYNVFTSDYKATIGVDFAVKMLKFTPEELGQDPKETLDTVVRLQLWDIAGQERFSNLTRAYYREALGALVVGDIESANIEEDIQIWKRDIDSKVFFSDTQDPIPCVLMCNKIDKPKAKEVYDEAKMADFAAQMGFIKHFATSALTGENLEAAIKELCKEILSRLRTSQVKPSNGLVMPENDVKQKKQCC